MAWVKYGENDLINLDKTTDIHIEKMQDKKTAPPGGEAVSLLKSCVS